MDNKRMMSPPFIVLIGKASAVLVIPVVLLVVL
jgi:hypothetical protein